MASKRRSNCANIASSCEPSLKQLDNTLPDLQLEVNLEYDHGGKETNVGQIFIQKLDDKDEGMERRKHFGWVSKRKESEAKEAANSRITDATTTESRFLETAEFEATTTATTSTPHKRDAAIEPKTQDDDYNDDTQLDNPIR